MAIMSLVATNARSQKQKPYNKKQAISNFVKKFGPDAFDMKDDAIDLRAWAKYFPNEIIPLEDIHQAILTVLGPKFTNRTVTPYDPSGGATITYPNTSVSPRFGYIDWADSYLWPIFQRDVAPNHCEKIDRDWDHTCAIVPCAIKITLKNGKTIYCIWDGHHTMQVMRLQGYIKFPIWYIDIDHIEAEQVESAGFENTDDGRIAYGAWLAGTNMRMINGKNKRPLSPYDDFMIGIETRDAQYVSMMNILRKHGCVPKRHGTVAGAFTQIKSGIECYELTDLYGNKGQFWDRALNFHRTLWPMAPLTLEVFRPLSMLYHRASLEGFTLGASFDKELAAIFVNKWGDSESVQEGIKESYWKAYNTVNKLKGQIPEHDKDRVLNGIINLYNQSGGKTLLPTPTCQWKV
jgi:hypothetical protein